MWRPIYILVTDGKDTSSKTRLDELKTNISQILVPTERAFKAYFIGIDLDQEEENNLKSLVKIVGSSGEFCKASAQEVPNIFTQIEAQIQSLRKNSNINL